eukprot:344461_1
MTSKLTGCYCLSVDYKLCLITKSMNISYLKNTNNITKSKCKILGYLNFVSELAKPYSHTRVQKLHDQISFNEPMFNMIDNNTTIQIETIQNTKCHWISYKVRNENLHILHIIIQNKK